MREGWEIKAFEDCLDKIKKTPKIPKNQFLSEGNFPIISQECDYINGYWDNDKDVLNVEKPVVLFGDHTKIVKYIDFNFVLGADGTKVFLPIKKINSKFFAYQLQSLDMPSLGYARHYRLLKNVNIVIPPLAEQKQIVAIFDEAFAAIDRARANIEKNIENAKELFQSKLNDIFAQKGEGWEVKKLGELGAVQTGTTPPTNDKKNYGNFIPFVKPAHFNPDGTIDVGDCMLSESGLAKGRLFPKNSILMVCIGATIGKTGFSPIPVSSNQQVNALTPNRGYNPKFLYYSMISCELQKQVLDEGKGSQATLPIINKTKWSNLNIRIPKSEDEQKEFVLLLDSLKNEALKTKDLYQRKILQLDELKKSILQKAFSGELTGGAKELDKALKEVA